MVNFILFVLATIGLTNIIIDGSIFAPLRNFLEKILPSKIYSIFQCFQCMGTWCGFICGFLLVGHSWQVVVCCGFAGSFIAVFGNVFINYLEARTIVSMGDQNGV